MKPRLMLSAMTIFLFTGGCATWTNNKDGLVDQAQRAVELTRGSITDRSRQAHQAFDTRRKQLDDAFDADVTERRDLSADWIVIHRQFYGKAVDQLHAARLKQSELDRNDKDNLQALSRVLDELRAIHSVERKLTGGAK